MSVKSGQAVTALFSTSHPTTGAATNATGDPTGTLYVNGTSDAAAVTVTNITTGVYKAAVTLPALSAGDIASLRIAATVATVAGEAIIWQDVSDTVRVSEVKAETALIVADTGELQTDWANGGRLDLLLDATATSAELATDAEVATAVRTELATELAEVSAIEDTVNHADYGNAKLVRSTTPANTLTVDASHQALALTNAVTNDAITAAAIANGAIDAATFAAGAIDAAAIATGAIDADAIADNAIDAGAIAADAITAAKLAADVTTELQSGLATAAELAKVPKSDSNVSWNATALAAIQQEATDALNAYDPPTNAELEARTLVAASYFDPAADTVANVTTVGSVTGAVGSVTGAVGSVTGNVGGNVAGSVASVTGNVGGNVTGSVGSVAAGGITAASIATGAIDADALAADAGAELADAVWDEALAGHAVAGSAGATLSAASAPTAADVADAVWEEAIADHSGTVGSTAEQLAAAGAAGDPWTTALPGAYADGTAGDIIGNLVTDIGALTPAVAISATTAASVSTGALAVRTYHSLSQAISSTYAGDLSAATKLWLAVKAEKDDTDAQSVIFIEKTAGLTVLAGAAYTTVAHGSLTVGGLAGAWTVTVALDEVATGLLTPYADGMLWAECKALVAGSTVAVWDGVCDVARGIVNAVA